MKHELTDVVGWSHFFLSEILGEGDRALDLTAGGGRDTLFLARQVGSGGKVFSFDIQADALARTARLLERENIGFSCHDDRRHGFSTMASVVLIQASHDRAGNLIGGKVKAAIANLGYLPGGDKKLTTRKETSLAALRQAAAMIEAGGRIAVVVYVGHPEGVEEEREVSRFFLSLNETEWRVMKFVPWNRKNPPALWVAEKC